MSHNILVLTDGRHPRQAHLVAVLAKGEWSLTVTTFNENELRDAVQRVRPKVLVAEPRGGDSTWIGPLVQLAQSKADIPLLVHPQDDDTSYTAGSALLGASGHLRRGAEPGLIMDAIKALAKGDLVWQAADLAQAADSLLRWRRMGMIPRAPLGPPDGDVERRHAALAARRCRLARAMLRYAESKDEVRRAIDAAICLGLPICEVEQVLNCREQIARRSCRVTTIDRTQSENS